MTGYQARRKSTQLRRAPQTFKPTRLMKGVAWSVFWVAQRWNPYRGRWNLKRLVKREIEANGGEMPVEDLLDRMKRQGYLKEPLRRSLPMLDIEVVGGKARLRGR